jgi:hypothetical protein
MCEEFSLHDRVMMQAMYEKRKWIVAYFKKVFFTTISQHKKVSVNSMLNGVYVDKSKSVHEFTKHFLDALVHIHDNEDWEKYYSQLWLFFILLFSF